MEDRFEAMPETDGMDDMDGMSNGDMTDLEMELDLDMDAADQSAEFETDMPGSDVMSTASAMAEMSDGDMPGLETMTGESSMASISENDMPGLETALDVVSTIALPGTWKLVLTPV